MKLALPDDQNFLQQYFAKNTSSKNVTKQITEKL